jgi:hypothetical protein
LDFFDVLVLGDQKFVVVHNSTFDFGQKSRRLWRVVKNFGSADLARLFKFLFVYEILSLGFRLFV